MIPWDTVGMRTDIGRREEEQVGHEIVLVCVFFWSFAVGGNASSEAKCISPNQLCDLSPTAPVECCQPNQAGSYAVCCPDGSGFGRCRVQDIGTQCAAPTKCLSNNHVCNPLADTNHCCDSGSPNSYSLCCPNKNKLFACTSVAQGTECAEPQCVKKGQPCFPYGDSPVNCCASDNPNEYTLCCSNPSPSALIDSFVCTNVAQGTMCPQGVCKTEGSACIPESPHIDCCQTTETGKYTLCCPNPDTDVHLVVGNICTTVATGTQCPIPLKK